MSSALQGRSIPVRQFIRLRKLAGSGGSITIGLSDFSCLLAQRTPGFDLGDSGKFPPTA